MIAPMLCTSINLDRIGRYVVDPDYVLEQKVDGHRVMLVGAGTDKVKALSRNGTRYTKGLPTRVQNWRLPVDVPEEHLLGQMVLDGELIDGELWVFDLLTADGSMDDWMLVDRRRALETVLREVPTPFKLVPQARTAEEKERLLLRCAEQHLEGVVAKRVDSMYRHGRRTDQWLKAKYAVTADLVVVAIRDDGHNSVSVGIATDGGLFKAIGRCSLNGKPAVQVGDVVEVRYLYVPDRQNPRLFQPNLVRVRTDKSAAECDGSDLRFTNKSVLESL